MHDTQDLVIAIIVFIVVVVLFKLIDKFTRTH